MAVFALIIKILTCGLFLQIAGADTVGYLFRVLYSSFDEFVMICMVKPDARYSGKVSSSRNLLKFIFGVHTALVTRRIALHAVHQHHLERELRR